MKNSKFYLVGLSVITVITAVIISCEKDENSKPPVGITNRIEIMADSIKNILYRDAKAYGSVGDYKNITFSQYGHCWDTLETPTIDNNKTEFQNLTAKSVFTSNLTNLKPNKTYYIRSYAKTNSIIVYSEIVNFQTRALEAPVVTTDSTSQIASTSANIWGTIALDGGTDISAKGVCWGITENPTLQNQHAEFTGAQDTFKVPVTGLEKYTTYYARIYAVNQTGTGYGSNITFKTLAEQPQLTTAEVTSITAYTATGGGSITSNGGAEITTRGICWGLDPNPTISNNQCVASVSTDNYTCNLTNLQPGKTYHVRAFATNIAGTSYGNDVTFTTPLVFATVITNEITDISSNSAKSGGNITSDGGVTVTARGLCWNTSPNPTINNYITNNGNGLGSFISDITSLQSGIKYYVRAYATNQAGTSYGNELQFNTLTIPTISTNSITNITGTTATSGGNVLTDGGATVTTRGVCWSINQNPTIADNHTTDGSGIGVFSSSITGLNFGTIYYVRAYATNSQGTVYGEERTFVTLNLPEITTSSTSNITGSSAVLGGNVINGGGGSIIARGVCWSTTQNPTTMNSHTEEVTGTGVFTSVITNLSPNTNYYVKAYATNNAGTAYGNEISFSTTNGYPAVTTTSATEITGTTATSGGNISSDGGYEITARGVCWSTSPNPTVANSHTSDSTGNGTFTSNLTNLSPNTTYYLKAYATNSITTSYGNEIMFTTGAVSLPTITTTIVTNITGTTAVSGGNITADGGASVTARGICWSTTLNPTLLDNYTTDGTGSGVFVSNISGLTVGVTYYLRAYATNTIGISYGNQISFVSIADGTIGSISDIDGNAYKTVYIGGKWWMAENLKTTKYKDGSDIPNIIDNGTWADLSTPAYCWYNNDETAYKDTYGSLYNWYAVSTGNLCPTGWHVPNDAEWYVLENYIDPAINDPNATGWRGIDGGTKLKASSGWNSEGNGTDAFGFSALPGGRRIVEGIFQEEGYGARWWSSTEYNAMAAWTRHMSYGTEVVYRYYSEKTFGYSVRCVND